jgi:serine/threonine-protein kinase haspin
MSLFASEHAPQCRVYRQMRSFLLRGDRVCLPPDSHQIAYADGIDGPISWAQHEPYTNVLWLAYIYEYIVLNFQGPRKDLNTFRRVTKDFWTHLDPNADENVPGFASASDIVMFAVESGWIDEDQLVGGRSMMEKSILSIMAAHDLAEDSADLGSVSPSLRRSPRRRM